MNETAHHIISGDFEKILIAVVVAALTIFSQIIITLTTKKSEFKAIKDNFKDALKQHEILTEKSGKINHHFNREALAFQIKLNHYETKSTEAIVLSYEHLVSLQKILMNFISDKDRSNKFGETFERIVEFRNLILAKKIWLPIEVLDLFNEILVELEQQLSMYATTLSIFKRQIHPTNEETKELNRMELEFFDYIIGFSTRISHFGDELAETIRLTMKSSPNSPLESPPTDSHTPAI